jgi:hypothetical protein
MRFLALLLMVGLFAMIGTVSAFAVDPWVQYSETDLGTGSWLYQFTIVNPLGSGESISDLLLQTSSGVINASPIGTGSGWAFDFISLDADQIAWYSPDVGSDVTAGSSLGGFSFQTSSQYTGSFAYTLGGSSGDFTGDASVVPEPGTMIASLALLSPAGISLAWRMRKRRARVA